MDATTRPDDHEGSAKPGRIVGVGLALLLLALAGMMLTKSPIEPLDGATSLGKHVWLGDLPFGFRPAESYALTSGEDFVLLDRGDERESRTEAIEDLASLSEGEAEQVDEESDEDPSFAETAAERERYALEDGTPPSLVYLVRYPAKHSLRVLKHHLARKSEDPDGESSEDVLEITIDGGRLPWGDYDADFVHERAYEKEGHFTDEVRVNMTLGDECWVMFALWPRDYRGSTEPIEALLAAMPPLDED